MQTVDCITHDIRVSVQVAYQGFNASGFPDHHLFAYQIFIENLGNDPVQLLNRHWLITDGFGQKRSVDGPGVVGQQPVIQPGNHFLYTSGCPLQSEAGSMQGTYEFENLRNGRRFDVDIPRFLLLTPQLSN